MAEVLKNVYNTDFYDALVKRILTHYPSFASKAFLKAIFCPAFTTMELKARMRHTTHCLHQFLPKNYKEAINILTPASEVPSNSFANMFFPDFVECYGMNDIETSMNALEHFTKFSSSEFAIRPFIINDMENSMRTMLGWSTNENHHVRRLASEGCRPKLPWAMALTAFQKDPSPILPILENLKNDSSEYVRRSVANNLNDISKDHPVLVLSITKKWIGKSNHTDRLLKHACRTLLKQGNAEALALFGFNEAKGVNISNVKWNSEKIEIGTSGYFSFNMHTEKAQNLRLEYAIDFLKSNGTHNKKVFRVSEKSYTKAQEINIKKKHSFKQMSTRKHYSGKHYLEIICNGKVLKRIAFELH